jgi:hypothetical protein
LKPDTPSRRRRRAFLRNRVLSRLRRRIRHRLHHAEVFEDPSPKSRMLSGMPKPAGFDRFTLYTDRRHRFARTPNTNAERALRLVCRLGVGTAAAVLAGSALPAALRISNAHNSNVS